MTRFGSSMITLLAAALLFGVPRVTHAAESYGNCVGFITSVPAVINTPGTWCLKNNLTTSMSNGNAIDVQSDNVIIDCNDFRLSGLTAGAGTTAYGIHSQDRVRITVRHCNIRGFYYGLILTGSINTGYHLVEDNRLDGNTYCGIEVDGVNSVIRRNRVFDTGGSTATPWDVNAYGIASGVSYSGQSIDIQDNTVFGVMAGVDGNAFGIQTVSNAAGSVSDNRVRGVASSGTGTPKGIASYSTVSRLTMRNNIVVGDAGAGSIGIYCEGASDRTMNNVINGFATGLSGCNSDGGNVIKP